MVDSDEPFMCTARLWFDSRFVIFMLCVFLHNRASVTYYLCIRCRFLFGVQTYILYVYSYSICISKYH